MLKVGDKLKCVKAVFGILTVNGMYTVTKVDPTYYWVLDDKGDKAKGYLKYVNDYFVMGNRYNRNLPEWF